MSKTPILDEFNEIYEAVVPLIIKGIVVILVVYGIACIKYSVEDDQRQEDYAAWLLTDEAAAEKYALCITYTTRYNSYSSHAECMASGMKLGINQWMRTDYNPANR